MDVRVQEADIFGNAKQKAILSKSRKFQNPSITANGQKRAEVMLTDLRTLWFNTGSLCNIACVNCYMGSSPVNNDLVYLSLNDVRRYLDEVEHEGYGLEEVGFTGGEPLMNNALPGMMTEALGRGYKVLLLTNAMKPLLHKKQQLLDINRRHGKALTIRVSLDHFTQIHHEAMRGKGTWEVVLNGLHWLTKNNFSLAIAGRTCWGDLEHRAREGYAEFFEREGLDIDAFDPARLVLFPEMVLTVDVPEITVHCWDILGVKPESIMCASSRMVVKKKGADTATVVPCTLLPYDREFEMGANLAGSVKAVQLNHPNCAKFCVLGGASCTSS